MTGSDKVVDAVIAALAPRDKMIDLSLHADRSVAIEALGPLNVEKSFCHTLESDSIAAKEEVFELEDRPRRLNVGIELGGFIRPPANDEGAQEGSQCRECLAHAGEQRDGACSVAISPD
jgi:hypothetical protein